MTTSMAWHRRGTFLPLLGLVLACAGNPPPAVEGDAQARTEATGADARGEARPGYGDEVLGAADSLGVLEREDVSLRMAGSGLIIDIIAMNPEVIGLAADDLRAYLEDALRKVPETVPPDLQREGTYFLVGFSSTVKEISFEPSQIRLESEGRQYYPRYIVPISTAFERKILQIFQPPVWAVYIFDPGIDLLSTLEFAYQDRVTTRGGWRRIVQNVEEARGRAKR